MEPCNPPLGCPPVVLGALSITPGALIAIRNAGQTPAQLIVRHHFGDWGELEPDDWERNNHALQNGLRLLSSYRLRDGTAVWLITEWDRSSTAVLLPGEY